LTTAPVPEFSLRAHGRTRRRLVVNRLMELVGTGAALLAVGVLGIVIVTVAQRGAPALNLNLLTKPTVPPGLGLTGGGIANAIVGSFLIVLIATAIALPLGVLIAIYLTEFAPWFVRRPVRLVLDVMNGIPTIVIGVFVFGLLVAGHGQSGFAGAIAYAVIMLPLVARATQEVLLVVPGSLREAGLALGVSRWRTVVGVIVPSSIGGILTATVLAMARTIGETAPLLFVSSIFPNSIVTNVGQPLPNIPVLIFQLSESADPHDHQVAWAASLVLLALVLIASLGARGLLARSRRRLAQ